MSKNKKNNKFVRPRNTTVAIDEIANIVYLRSRHYSNRAISKMLWGVSTRESTVRSILSKYKEGYYDNTFGGEIELKIETLKNNDIDIDTNTNVHNEKPIQAQIQIQNQKSKLNILFFDIETSPCISYHFQHWNINIRPEHKIKDTHMLTVSWAFNDEPIKNSRIKFEDIEQGNDIDVVLDIVNAINKSDIIVGYNSKRFDIKYINTRALYHNIKPLKPVKHIDLYEQVKKNFLLSFNSMQFVSKYLGLEGKYQHGGFEMWANAMSKNKDLSDKALEEMVVYNDQDIEATRELYYKMQGWFKQVPNVGLMENIKHQIENNLEYDKKENINRCSKCGSKNVTNIPNEMYFTTAKSYTLYRCDDCDGISRLSPSGLVGCI